MLSEHIEDALGGALTVPALEEIARTVWRAVEAGSLGWEEAGRLDGLVRARRGGAGGGGGRHARARGPARGGAASAPAAQPRSRGVGRAASACGVVGCAAARAGGLADRGSEGDPDGGGARGGARGSELRLAGGEDRGPGRCVPEHGAGGAAAGRALGAHPGAAAPPPGGEVGHQRGDGGRPELVAMAQTRPEAGGGRSGDVLGGGWVQTVGPHEYRRA